MLMKYTILTIRRPLYLVMYYVIPVIALVSMRLSVGQSPFDLNVAVFNADLNPELSQKFIDSIDKNYITINKYEDNRTAYESVVSGKNYVSIVFSENFTETFETRLTDLLQMDDFEIDNSQIRLYMDFSNAVVGAFVLKYMIEAFKAFCDTLTQSFGSNLFRFLSPVQVTECVYGSLDLDVTAHFGPSALVVVANSLPMILSAFNIVNDRKTASFERVFVAGVRPIEYFIAHTVINVFLVISQVMCSTFISFVILQNTQLGNYMEVFAVLTLQGYMGLSIGLMGSLLLADEVSVAVGVTGFMLPIWIMSGVLWPLEAIPFYFRYISDLSPITLPLDALRSIMLRGWSYTRPNVLYGYGISIFYSVVFTLLNMIIFQKFTDKAFSLQFWNF